MGGADIVGGAGTPTYKFMTIGRGVGQLWADLMRISDWISDFYSKLH